MIRIAAALGAVLATFTAPAARAEQSITEFRLDNGMQAVVIEDDRSPAVTHMVWYRVGAADEPPGKSGIAHYLEHLMFKGTENRAPDEFSRIVRENGGSENAFTSWDYTGYYQRVAADRLGLMMQLEADRMANLSLTEELVAPELGVVLEERSQRIDSDPGALFREQARAAQYLNHPYGRPIIGWRQEIEDLSLADAKAFYRRHYAPNNAVLVVAGGVTAEEVRRLAEEHYGAVAANPELGPRTRPAEPPQRAERRVIFEDPRIAQPLVVRSYLAPERDAGAQAPSAALVYLADLLGGDMQTSFLGRRLVNEGGLALYTAAFYSPTALDDTTFGLYAVPAQGTGLAELEAALDAALADFVRQGPDPERMERLRRQYAAQAVYDRDSAEGLAQRYGASLTSGLTVADVRAWPDLLQQVTREDVMQAAEALLVRERAVTGLSSAGPGAAAGSAATPAAGQPEEAIQ